MKVCYHDSADTFGLYPWHVYLQVPHVFRPEVQLVEVSIEEYVPRGKKPKDSDAGPVPAYTKKLTDAENSILAKYFSTARQTAWRPSLIAFPHFQAFPSPINKVSHSSRTGILIDTMQYLQGITYSSESKTSSEVCLLSLNRLIICTVCYHFAIIKSIVLMNI